VAVLSGLEMATGMPDLHLWLLPAAYTSVGLLVGILIGLTGMGGGSLLTPLLVTVFGQSPMVSVGTDLAFAAGTKLVVTASSDFRLRIDWPIVRRLAVGSLPGALLVILWIRMRPASVVNAVILDVLAVLLILAAAALLLRQRFRTWGLTLTTAMLEDVAGYQTAATVATGALIGMAVALTSVGAGALGTVALVFLYPLRLSTERLVATDIAQALPLTALAAFGHVALGHTDWSLVLSLLAGSVPGVLVGSRLAVKIPEVLLRRLLAATLGVSAWRLLAYQG
jgi:uncharacterized membrane protein YfcA